MDTTVTQVAELTATWGEVQVAVVRKQWLPAALGVAEFERVKDLPLSLLQELYAPVFLYGPNCFEMHNFEVLLINALDALPDTGAAARFMNCFRGVYNLISEDMAGGIKPLIRESQFEILNRFNGKSFLTQAAADEPFFLIYPYEAVFQQTYRHAKEMILLRHFYEQYDFFAPLWAGHQRFVTYLEALVSGTASASPRSRAILSGVTGTTSEP